ncbi:MAG TPA: sigma-70 family RNA polymerase sigma factor [Bacteroidia bacterium]|nr:sigma-70 family RNA polymerase sigma factor [Bacteroidia bacterium]
MSTEEDILDGCISGKRESQELLYKKFSGKMFAVCLRYCRDHEEAQDVLQDGFVRVFGNISAFRRDGSLEGWIRRIMVNTALMHLRAKKREPDFSDIDNIAMRYHPESYFDTAAQVNAQELMRMLEALPDGYRTVFNLFAIEGYSHKEIGEMLGITEGTSKSQLSKARGFLQEMLQKVMRVSIKENTQR